MCRLSNQCKWPKRLWLLIRPSARCWQLTLTGKRPATSAGSCERSAGRLPRRLQVQQALFNMITAVHANSCMHVAWHLWKACTIALAFHGSWRACDCSNRGDCSLDIWEQAHAGQPVLCSLVGAEQCGSDGSWHCCAGSGLPGAGLAGQDCLALAQKLSKGTSSLVLELQGMHG